MIIICNFTHSRVWSCLWLCHNADGLHALTRSVPTLYCIICVQWPHSPTTATSWQMTDIHKQLYQQQNDMKELLQSQKLKTQTFPQVTNLK